MKRLSQEAFERARCFLKTQARPLDQALFSFRFEQASPEQVTTTLSTYQNADGGFGHALEPDLRTPSSSALATGIGLHILKELGCSADHPMVSHAVQYLLDSMDHQTQRWRVAPQDTNAFPHAGWWHDEQGSLGRTFHNYYIIPRAKIVALLHHYSARVPSVWLHQITEVTVADIEAEAPHFGDEVVYALELAETEAVPRHWRDRLLPGLRAVVPTIVERDPQKWQEYCLPPIVVAPSPHAAVADLLWEDIQAYLDYRIDQQTADGAWEPFWTWGEDYPAVWEQAKQEWRGYLTLETVTTLHVYGRIEGQPK